MLVLEQLVFVLLQLCRNVQQLLVVVADQGQLPAVAVDHLVHLLVSLAGHHPVLQGQQLVLDALQLAVAALEQPLQEAVEDPGDGGVVLLLVQDGGQQGGLAAVLVLDGHQAEQLFFDDEQHPVHVGLQVVHVDDVQVAHAAVVVDVQAASEIAALGVQVVDDGFVQAQLFVVAAEPVRIDKADAGSVVQELPLLHPVGLSLLQAVKQVVRHGLSSWRMVFVLMDSIQPFWAVEQHKNAAPFGGSGWVAEFNQSSWTVASSLGFFSPRLSTKLRMMPRMAAPAMAGTLMPKKSMLPPKP